MASHVLISILAYSFITIAAVQAAFSPTELSTQAWARRRIFETLSFASGYGNPSVRIALGRTAAPFLGIVAGFVFISDIWGVTA